MKPIAPGAAVAFVWFCLTLASVPGLARTMLAPGDVAPDIKGPSVIDGQVQTFDLKDAAKKKAVVLYFFPAAFTSG